MVKDILHFAEHIKKGKAKVPKCLDLLVNIKEDRLKQQQDIDHLNGLNQEDLKNEFNISGILKYFKSTVQSKVPTTVFTL